MVPSPAPGGPVRDREQRLDLRVVEVADDGLFPVLERDGQYLGDEFGVLGVAERGVGEQRVDRGEAGVAGPGAVPPVLFEHHEESADELGVEQCNVDVAGPDAGLLLHVAEQQPERVAVGGDGVTARGPLPREVVGEERLQRRGERAHLPAPGMNAAIRSETAAISSGVELRYQ